MAYKSIQTSIDQSSRSLTRVLQSHTNQHDAELLRLDSWSWRGWWNRVIDSYNHYFPAPLWFLVSFRQWVWADSFPNFFLMEIPYAGLNHELILRLRQVRLKRLGLHTQAVTPTQSVTVHTNILTVCWCLSSFCVVHSPSACPSYKLSITLSLS